MRTSREEAVWRPLEPSGHVLTLKYSWGPATANALAVRLETGGFLVVSPPVRPSESVWQELANKGGVKALLAPNKFHYLGQAAWRALFPAAISFAPTGALSRLREKARDVPFEPAETLQGSLPASVRLVFPDGQKSPDMLVRIASKQHENIWWLGDLFSNTTPEEQVWFLRILARLAGSGPGYRRTSRPELVYVNDRSRWVASVRDALTSDPPTVVVPAHGDPVIEQTYARTLRALDHGRADV